MSLVINTKVRGSPTRNVVKFLRIFNTPFSHFSVIQYFNRYFERQKYGLIYKNPLIKREIIIFIFAAKAAIALPLSLFAGGYPVRPHRTHASRGYRKAFFPQEHER